MDIQNSPMYQRIDSPVNETKVHITVDSKTPILTRIPVPPGRLTLGTFKRYAALNDKSYKFYFKSHDLEFGTVKEELVEDDSILPVADGCVVVWVMSSSNPQQSTLFGSENPYDKLTNTHHSESYGQHLYKQPIPLRPDQTFNHGLLYNRTTTGTTCNPNNVIVNLYLGQNDTLGLTLLCPDGEIIHPGGLLIDKVQPGSVSARDGRLNPGDRIVEINNIDLRHALTREAVMVFREIIDNKGAIRLTLQKASESSGIIQSKGLQSNSQINRRPHKASPLPTCGGFDPATELPSPIIEPDVFSTPDRYGERKLTNDRATYSLPRSLTPRSLYTTSNLDTHTSSTDLRPTLDSQSVYGPTTPNSLRQIGVALHCSKDSIGTIYAYLKSDAASLDIRDREWLKVVVKNAFLGSTLVKWLSRNVYGFCNRSETKRFANKMLTLGLVKSPMSSGTFSEKCYYVLT